MPTTMLETTSDSPRRTDTAAFKMRGTVFIFRPNSFHLQNMRKVQSLQRNFSNPPKKQGEMKWTFQPYFDFSTPAWGIGLLRLICVFPDTYPNG
jgi:hypothetical protein